MGRDIKGRNLGTGLSQRKSDKRYIASFIDSGGRRRFRTFVEFNKARQWLIDAKCDDHRNALVLDEGMTVNEWFEKWIKGKEQVIRFNTARNYKERYNRNVKKVIGRMRMIDVKSIHCQNVLNIMAEEGYAEGTVEGTLRTMVSMFLGAVDNDIIRKSPINRTNVIIPRNLTRKPVDFFTVEEERRFIEMAKNYSYYNQYRFILETGLRAGELIALEWKNVDLANRQIFIRKNPEYRYSTGEWRWGVPKTRNSIRTVNLTNTAYEILLYVKKHSNLKDSTPPEFRDVVFLNKHTGEPTKNSSYNTSLFKICEKLGLKKVSMHDLRHTMATRFCEVSSNYKYLSEMLGHSSIKITMDRYVHMTKVNTIKEIGDFSSYMDDILSCKVT